MSIMYKYLDKRAAAIAAIKDYDSMQFIIRNTDREIISERDKMVGTGSPDMDGMPHAHDPQAGEKRILQGIEEIDMLKERYRQAVEYMSWFKPAWEQLSEEERYLLEMFYMDDEESGAVMTITAELNIERSTAYNRKNRALDHLTMLLYGKA